MRTDAGRSTRTLATFMVALFGVLTATRADCPPTDCGPGPCVSIKAVAVNGNPITPTNCVIVLPGDLIETELYISGWGTELPLGVRAYQLSLFLLEGATSGSGGLVLPVGWDAPVEQIPCSTSATCPPEFPICSGLCSGCCSGPDHDPEIGAFIDTQHPGFILSGLDGLFPVDVASLHYRYLGVAADSVGVEDVGIPRYAGTLRLRVSGDAFGSFVFDFDTRYYSYTFLMDPLPWSYVVNPNSVPLVVQVCQDDGLFCNGLETFDPLMGCVAVPPNCDDGNECTTDSCNEDTDSCDHVVTCGACCDSWIGACDDGVAQADCNCTNCVWTGAAACAAVECEAEFVAIPTVSQWGLVVLTLLLFTGAKLRFGRRGDALTASLPIQ